MKVQLNLLKRVSAMTFAITLTSGTFIGVAQATGSDSSASVYGTSALSFSNGTALQSHMIEADADHLPGFSAFSLMFSDPASTLITGLNLIVSREVSVKCLVATDSPKKSWYSGRIKFYTNDPRTNRLGNEQHQLQIAAGTYLEYSRVEKNAKGFFFAENTRPYVSVQDAGGIWTLDTKVVRGAEFDTYCKQKDAVYSRIADFQQLSTVGTSTRCCTADKVGCTITLNRDGTNASAKLNGQSVPLCDIEWLDPNDLPLNPRVVRRNVPNTFLSPPQASLFDISGVSFPYQAGVVKIKTGD